MIIELPTLPIGTAWFWSPGWLDIFKKVEVRQRETLDSSSTPKVGDTSVKASKVAPVNIDELKEKLAATIEKAESEDPKLLRRRIVELEKQLADQKPQVEIKEVPVITEDQMDKLTSTIGELDGYLKSFQAASGALTAAYKPFQREQPAQNFVPEIPKKATVKGFPGIPDGTEVNIVSEGDVNLRAGERRILQVLAQHYPMHFSRNQLGTLSRFSPRGGTFGTYFGTLKRNGLIEENGDVMITQAGLDYLGTDVPAPATTEEVINMWRSALRAGERKMLDYLVKIYPDSVSREELGVMTDFEHRGGTFGTYLGSLRRNGLIRVEGANVTASDSLFIGGVT